MFTDDVENLEFAYVHINIVNLERTYFLCFVGPGAATIDDLTEKTDSGNLRCVGATENTLLQSGMV